MDTLKDIWASLVDGLKERTTNPLSFSFLLSWAAWNFKFFVVLFGDGTAAQRIAAIDAMYPLTLATYLHGAFGFPLVTALVYVFLYPFVSAKAIKFYRSKQVEIANTVKSIERDRLVSREQLAERTLKHENERKQWNEDEAALITQVRELREAITLSEKQNLELKKAQKGPLAESTSAVIGKVDPQLTEGGDVPFNGGSKLPPMQASEAQSNSGVSISQPTADSLKGKLLLTLSDAAGGVPAPQLATMLSENYTVVELALEEMRQGALIRKSDTGRWALAPAGKNRAVELLARPKRSGY